MKEGWHNDQYYILLEPAEVEQITEAYDLARYIPSHKILGILGWDDFILENQAGERFTVPTVPLDPKYLEPLGTCIEEPFEEDLVDETINSTYSDCLSLN